MIQSSIRCPQPTNISGNVRAFLAMQGICGNVGHIWQCGSIFNNVGYLQQYGLFLRVWTISGNGRSLMFQHRSRSNPAWQSNQWAGKKKNNTGVFLTLSIPFFAFLFTFFFFSFFDSFFLSLKLSPFYYDKLTEPISTSFRPFFILSLL